MKIIKVMSCFWGILFVFSQQQCKTVEIHFKENVFEIKEEEESSSLVLATNMS